MPRPVPAVADSRVAISAVTASPGGVPDLARRVRRIVAALLAGAGPGPR